MDPRRQDFMGSLGLLVLRIGFGGYMLSHGWGKLKMLLEGDTAGFADPLGLGETLSLLGAVTGEFVGALLVLIGLCTRFAAIPTFFTMLVAGMVVHKADPWTMGHAAKLFMEGATKFPASKEPALLFACAFLALALMGAGKYSFDGMILPQLRAQRAKRKALGQ